MSGTHKHKCPDDACGEIWEHGDECRSSVEAHLCPKCGKMQRYKYFPPDHEDVLSLRKLGLKGRLKKATGK